MSVFVEHEGKVIEFPDAETAQQFFSSASSGGVSVNSQALGEFQQKGMATLRGFQNGATLGLLDEASGALAGVAGAVPEDGTSIRLGDYSGTFGDRYRARRDQLRKAHAASKTVNPVAYGGGEMIGGAAQGLTSIPLATGNGILNTVIRGAGIGAAEGGVYGAGNANGENVLAEAGRGALTGGLLGAVIPAAVAGGASVRRMVTDPVTGLLGIANKGKANRALANTLMQSGKTPKQAAQAVLQAAQEGQTGFRVMDALGVPGQRRASGLVRAGGDSGNELAEFLAERQAGQAERVASFVDEGFALNGATAANIKNELKEVRSEVADAAYGAARGNAAPVDVQGALAVIDARTGTMKGSNIAGDGIDAKLLKFRNRLSADPAPGGEIARELSDFDRVLSVKQEVQDEIGAAVRAGRGNEARELGKLVAALDQALEASSPSYRMANDGFRDASRVIDAVDEGALMARPSVRADDTTAQFAGMNPDQRAAARVGYGDSLLGKIEANAAPTANKAKALQSPKRKAEAEAIALYPNLYNRRLARENQMWETQNRALGGSRTADNLEDIQNVGDEAAGLFGAARSVGNFQLGDAASQIGAVLLRGARGQTDETRALIARALMSNDPAAVLEPAMKKYNATQMQRRVIEAILRGATRPLASQEK